MPPLYPRGNCVLVLPQLSLRDASYFGEERRREVGKLPLSGRCEAADRS